MPKKTSPTVELVCQRRDVYGLSWVNINTGKPLICAPELEKACIENIGQCPDIFSPMTIHVQPHKRGSWQILTWHGIRGPWGDFEVFGHLTRELLNLLGLTWEQFWTDKILGRFNFHIEAVWQKGRSCPGRIMNGNSTDW